MLMVNQLIGFAVGDGPVATIAHTDNKVDTTGANPLTYSTAAFGTAAANRKIVVGATNLAAGVNISSMTIGGVSATLVVRLSVVGIELWEAAVPTGTTGDVVVTFASSPGTRNSIGVWAIYGAGAAYSAAGTSTADPLSVSLNIPGGGVAIGYAGDSNGGVGFSWTNLTENFDQLISGGYAHSGASAAFAAAQTSLALSCQPNSATFNGMVAASWGPA